MTTGKPDDIPQDFLRAAAIRVFEFETAVQSGQFTDEPDGKGAHELLTSIIARSIMAGYTVGWNAAVRTMREG